MISLAALSPGAVSVAAAFRSKLRGLVPSAPRTTMGGVNSAPIVETVGDHCLQCAQTSRELARQTWVAVNSACAHSAFSCIWPTSWSEAAEEDDIIYLPVNARLDSMPGGEQFQYSSDSSPSRRAAPMPYLSQPRDRALYAIDDDEEPSSASSSISPTPRTGIATTTVPHYSYRPPHDIALAQLQAERARAAAARQPSSSPPRAVTMPVAEPVVRLAAAATNKSHLVDNSLTIPASAQLASSSPSAASATSSSSSPDVAAATVTHTSLPVPTPSPPISAELVLSPSLADDAPSVVTVEDASDDDLEDGVLLVAHAAHDSRQRDPLTSGDAGQPRS